MQRSSWVIDSEFARMTLPPCFSLLEHVKWRQAWRRQKWRESIVNQHTTKFKRVNNFLRKSFFNGFITLRDASRIVWWSNNRVLVRSKKERKNKRENATAGRRECQSKACASSGSERTRDNTPLRGICSNIAHPVTHEGEGRRKYATRYFSATLFPAIAWRLTQEHQERCLNDLHHRKDCRQTNRVIISWRVVFNCEIYLLRLLSPRASARNSPCIMRNDIVTTVYNIAHKGVRDNVQTAFDLKLQLVIGCCTQPFAPIGMTWFAKY